MFTAAIKTTALTGLLCALATAPASAAPGVPAGWESAALGLPAAHALSQGKGITVAVLDTGANADHPALAGRVTTGPDYVGDGASQDSDSFGRHGTAMASSVLKVAPQAQVLSIRVIDEADHKNEQAKKGTSPISKGIDYAVKHGADVISLSLGDDNNMISQHNSAESQSIGHAVSQGIPVLASSGNSADNGNTGAYPAGYPSVIAVAATDKKGARGAFSTVRSYNAVAAPGVDVTMAKKAGGSMVGDGTSPACAFASGVVALMLADHPKLTPAQVRSVLTTTAHHPTGGHNALVGYGTLDAPAAVRAAASAPADRTVPVKYTGKEHLGTPDGTARSKHAPMEQDIWLGGLGAAGAGLLLVIGAILLGRRRRPAGAAR